MLPDNCVVVRLGTELWPVKNDSCGKEGSGRRVNVRNMSSVTADDEWEGKEGFLHAGTAVFQGLIELRLRRRASAVVASVVEKRQGFYFQWCVWEGKKDK